MKTLSVHLRIPPKLLTSLRKEAKESETTLQTIIRRFLQERIRIRHREKPVDPMVAFFSKPGRRR